MRCRECQQFLYDYIDNTLAPERTKLIREHLDDCPACLDAYNQENELSQAFHETAASLQQRLHCRMRLPLESGRIAIPANNRSSFLLSKWAAVAVFLAIAVLCARFFVFRPPDAPLRQKAQVTLPGKSGGHQGRRSGQTDEREKVIQIISIEDGSGQLSETHFRQEIHGLVTEITVEVTAVRLKGESST